MGGTILKDIAYESDIAKFKRVKGITYCPPAYAAPTQAYLDVKHLSSSPSPKSNGTKLHPTVAAKLQKNEIFTRKVWQKIVDYANSRELDPRLISATEVADAFNREGFRRRIFLPGGMEDEKEWTSHSISQIRSRALKLLAAESNETSIPQTASPASRKRSQDEKPQSAQRKKREEFYKSAAEMMQRITQDMGKVTFRGVRAKKMAKQLTANNFRHPVLSHGAGPDDFVEWTSERVSAIWKRFEDSELVPKNIIG